MLNVQKYYRYFVLLYVCIVVYMINKSFTYVFLFQVCFDDINARSLVERQREEEEQARLAAARKQRVEKAKQDLIGQ